jgi:hypothetical protein
MSAKRTSQSGAGYRIESDQSVVSGCSHPGPDELMPQRLKQLGLDYVRVALTATYRDLERVCATCRAWRCCVRDLANGDVQAGMSSYCLNAFTIDTLTIDWPKTRKH